MSNNDNKVCDSWGIEIPNSAKRSMSDIDTYWCDDCEAGGSDQSNEALEERLSDRDALGVEARADESVGNVSSIENGS